LVNENPNNPAIRERFMRWNKITIDGKKVVSNGLVNRRKAEADLYFKEFLSLK
jgi:lysozyme